MRLQYSAPVSGAGYPDVRSTDQHRQSPTDAATDAGHPATARLIARLRWGLAAILVLGALAADSPLAAMVCLAAAGMVLAVNLCQALGLVRPAGQGAITVLLAVDTTALATGLMVTGGATNPLVGLLVLPLAIAGTSLGTRAVVTLLALTVAQYGVLTLWHLPLPIPGASTTTIFHWHVLGMWGAFAATAVLLSASLLYLARQLRQREREIQRIRHQLLRREAVVAVATEAAVTSHEISTPLSTALMLAEEASEEPALTSEARERLGELTTALTTCRDALMRLRRIAVEARHDGTETVALPALMSRVAERFRALNPHTRLEVDLDEPARTLHLAIEPHAVIAALLNLLDNAAEASDGDAPVRLAVRRSDSATPTVRLLVTDRGPGMPPDFQINPYPTSSKDDGLGVGVLLSHSTLERFGGRLTCHREPHGGNTVAVTLPAREAAA